MKNTCVHRLALGEGWGEVLINRHLHFYCGFWDHHRFESFSGEALFSFFPNRKDFRIEKYSL